MLWPLQVAVFVASHRVACRRHAHPSMAFDFDSQEESGNDLSDAETIEAPQLMVHCWFGARCFGILGVHPRLPIPFIRGFQESKPLGPKPTMNQEFQVPKMEAFLNLIFGYLGVGFPYISRIHTAYIVLHFRYQRNVWWNEPRKKKRPDFLLEIVVVWLWILILWFMT